MANTFTKLSFDDLVEEANEYGPIVEASRRIVSSTNSLAIVIAVFTAVILVVNILMAFPQLKS